MGSMKTNSSMFSSNPLISALIALYTVIFLYFRGLILSPVLFSASVLLLSLFRFGASQKTARSDPVHSPEPSILHDPPIDDPGPGSKPDLGPGPNPNFDQSFVEWNVRAPLEVIHEEYEGEDQNGVVLGEIQRYASLSLYYPETDSDSDSSEGNIPAKSPEKEIFRWDCEREELIEIKLDEGKRRSYDCEVIEEDNLIEIDLYDFDYD